MDNGTVPVIHFIFGVKIKRKIVIVVAFTILPSVSALAYPCFTQK